jgi:hypothetical protein
LWSVATNATKDNIREGLRTFNQLGWRAGSGISGLFTLLLIFIVTIFLVPSKMVDLQRTLTGDDQAGRILELVRAVISWSLLFLSSLFVLTGISIQLSLAWP